MLGVSGEYEKSLTDGFEMMARDCGRVRALGAWNLSSFCVWEGTNSARAGSGGSKPCSKSSLFPVLCYGITM